MSPITQLLQAAQDGNPQAAAELLPIVYQELRQLAAAKMQHEKPGQTLSGTALVHEAYLRLVASPTSEPVDAGHPQRAGFFQNRNHFFAAAAEAMRRILVDHHRARTAAKRGGQMHRLPFEALQLAAVDSQQILEIHEALDALEQVDAEAALLVKLRFFAGFSTTEAATTLGMSVRSTHDLWTYAKTWLHRQLRKD